MYQNSLKDKTEDDFNLLLKLFSEHIFPVDHIESDPTEWDMNAVYYPNWACAWNSRDMVGQTCKILTKNDKMALVGFSKPMKVPQILYRLEDLTKTRIVHKKAKV